MRHVVAHAPFASTSIERLSFARGEVLRVLNVPLATDALLFVCNQHGRTVLPAHDVCLRGAVLRRIVATGYRKHGLLRASIGGTGVGESRVVLAYAAHTYTHTYTYIHTHTHTHTNKHTYTYTAIGL